MSGCYICRPDDPDAAEEGCEDCERDFWLWAIRGVADGVTPT